MTRQITNTDITTAFGATAYAAAYVTMQSPNTKSFGLAWKDDAGNVIRTYDQPTGRIDLYTNSAAGQTVGPAMVLVFNNLSPADGNNLGHYAFRGNDSNLNANTYAYVLGNAMTVSAAGLSSKLTLGVMNNLAAGAGNAQPNVGVLIDGSTMKLSMPAGMSFMLAASTTARTSLNILAGTAPTSPVDGDVWREDNTNTGLKIRINGVTKTVTVS